MFSLRPSFELTGESWFGVICTAAKREPFADIHDNTGRAFWWERGRDD